MANVSKNHKMYTLIGKRKKKPTNLYIFHASCKIKSVAFVKSVVDNYDSNILTYRNEIFVEINTFFLDDKAKICKMCDLNIGNACTSVTHECNFFWFSNFNAFAMTLNFCKIILFKSIYQKSHSWWRVISEWTTLVKRLSV